MKHIHIIEPYHSIAMSNTSAPLMELAQLYKVTTGEEIDYGADLNIHFPWHTMAGKERGTSKHIIMYTHVNPNMTPHLMDACERADLVTAMSFEGRRELVSLGVDPKKIWVNYCAPRPFPYRRRLIVVVGYPQPNGRKREHLLLDMAWEYDLRTYDFLFVGTGWDDLVSQLTTLGVAARTLNADTFEKLSLIYQRADALLVTSYVEGGPLPILEAMANSVKIFSPRFGYAADLLDDDDIYSDLPDLMEKMEAYFRPSLDSHILANSWTWQDYTAEFALLIGRLLGESVDLYPERGMSRYTQLLDVIDEVHPASIVEIGTWSGSNAIRMIQQAAKYRPIERVSYQGFDLFGSQTTADFVNELSKHGWLKHIVQKRLDATGAQINLVEGHTRDTLFRNGKGEIDFFFVDGGHSEETIQHDALVICSMKPSAVVIFDDYYHSGQPEGFGCNKVVDSLDRNEFEVTHLPVRTLASDGREIGMVKVRRNNGDISLQRWQTSTGSYLDFRASNGG